MKIELIKKLKSNSIQLPIWLGQVFAYYPYAYRPIIGKYYRVRKNEIASFNHLTLSERQDFIFQKMYSIVEYAIRNIPFYQKYYKAQGFSITDLKCFDDIKKIPIIDKKILLQYSLFERSNERVSKFLVNTGGSSGLTLSFYVQPSAIGHEWAHIHSMWKLLGFKASDLRLFMAGRNVIRNGVDYDFARHALTVDIYMPYDKIAPLLKKRLRKHPCFYLHGYPSVLSEFAEYCNTDIELLALLRNSLKGAFLSSEYPYPMYRDVIERVFHISTQSFYGHTERCIMAYECSKKFSYIPFQTYGFTEAIKNSNGNFDLIGTSYYNQASPLIRYNTNDVIDNPCFEGGILASFDILEGRSGQFILDSEGKKISLTGLIMGRHHPMFDLCRHIQVAQSKLGEAIIFYVPRDGVNFNPIETFDSKNVKIKFQFKELSEPIRTVSGKINLLVKQ